MENYIEQSERGSILYTLLGIQTNLEKEPKHVRRPRSIEHYTRQVCMQLNKHFEPCQWNHWQVYFTSKNNQRYCIVFYPKDYVDQQVFPSVLVFLSNMCRPFFKSIQIVRTNFPKIEFHVKIKKRFRDDIELFTCERCGNVWDGLAQCMCNLSQSSIPSLSSDDTSYDANVSLDN